MINDLLPHLPIIGVGVLQLLTAVILGFAMRSARLQSRANRKKLGIEAVFTLKSEYSGLAYFVYQLHDFFKYCKSHDGDAVTEFNRTVQDEQKQGKNNLQMSMQMVSQFYQKLAMYYTEELASRDMLFSVWPWRDLELLDDLIVPVEESIEGHSTPSIDALKRLYKDSMRYRDR